MLAALAGGSCLVLASTAVVACSDDTAGSTGEGSEAGADAQRSDSSTPDEDGSTKPDAEDAGTDAKRDANVRDAAGPGMAGDDCLLNYDCQLALRCECDESAGTCQCKAGARGTGQNGVDPCTSGENCQSALCIEGPPDAGSFCSDECATSDDCGGKLPLCLDVAFVGRVCVRTPPK